jgi:hypothetical protein
MTRINAAGNMKVRNIAATRSSVTRNSVAWGSKTWDKQATTWSKNTGALIFAAVLIVCSLTVGCSSDNKPKPVASNIQVPAPPTPNAMTPMPAPPAQPAVKPAPKKVVQKKPATVNYADKTYGVTFEYPRRYAIETGDAAGDLLAANPMAMNFIQPGGVALAAVELPETGFANTDFSSAFFDVSVHKSLTADQCTEFAVPQPKGAAVATSNEATTSSPVAAASATSNATSSVNPAATPTETASTTVQAAPGASSEQTSAAKSSTDLASNSKLMLGDLELRATEAVSGEGTRQSDSKYFHVYQNGSCYEFALNVTTDASAEGLVKHVDRDKVFTRLEQILATVKIDTPKTATPETTAEVPAPAATPAQ